MTAHWIDVKEGKWKLRAEVVGFQPVSGDHSGENLGKYFVGLCDRVGIMSTLDSKVRSGPNVSELIRMISITNSFQLLPLTTPQITIPAARLLRNSMSADTFNGMQRRISFREYKLFIINLISYRFQMSRARREPRKCRRNVSHHQDRNHRELKCHLGV
jgi:hypothetical protein